MYRNMYKIYHTRGYCYVFLLHCHAYAKDYINFLRIVRIHGINALYTLILHEVTEIVNENEDFPSKDIRVTY